MFGKILKFFICLPYRFLHAILFFDSIEKYKEYAQKPFVCPNCGNHIIAKWYSFLFWRWSTFYTNRTLKLKCHNCKQLDMCKWSSDEEIK